MIIRDLWYKFDDRCLSHPGVIIDIGCLEWDWSKYFFDKNKKVIGFDPIEETQPDGAELRKQILLPYSGGKRVLYGFGTDSSILKIISGNNTSQYLYDVVSLDNVLSEFSIMPSLIKMNIEGSEYPLLFSLKSPPSDQLIVSFHDWRGDFKLSDMVRDYLSMWYNWTITYEQFNWWMGLLKDEFRVLK